MPMEMFYPAAISYQIVEISYHSGNSCVFLIPFPCFVTLELCADLGALGNYPGSPFLPSDSEILLDSPENEDIVEDFFADSVPGPPSQSDEEKS
ncbi:hypothetical protein OIU85_011399 [Salix viminalis]|uniref:Uncharacterized protein n=1 Tax=Salix viminalis TaxID=40686 RepID=A0A9Q0SFT5_SALVM|nr:hypothetical protein OIU85_011399 [Salix viminalis]